MTTAAVFEAAVRESRRSLLRRARFVTVRSNIDAEDLVQQALLNAWHFWQQVADRVVNVKRWLFTVMHWTWCDMADHAARRPTCWLSDKIMESLVTEQPDTLMMVDVDRALRAMPAMQGDRLRDAAFTGDTMREIGERHGVTSQAVHYQVVKARQFLDRRGLNARNISR